MFELAPMAQTMRWIHLAWSESGRRSRLERVGGKEQRSKCMHHAEMHRHSNTVQNSGETVQAEVYFGVLGLEVTDYCDSHMDFEMNFFERKGRTLCSSM